jgi:hypothetical protein
MSINTSLTGVIIEGNTFAYGNFAGNPSSTPCGYDNCMVSTADANISKNYFSGINNVDTIPLVVEPGSGGSPSCLITKNVFVRGSTTVQAYIDVSNVGTDQVIVENEFDQYTTDGYNDNNLVLVPIGGANILYERNKNQTAIAQIHKAPYKIGFSATPSLCAFDRSAYTGDIVYNPTTYSSTNGYLTGSFPGTSPHFFKNEGITMNYSAPFSSASAVKLVGQFSVVDGYNGVGVSAGTIGVYGINSGTQGYILFGNDNVYYLATLNISPDSTPYFITSITLATNYKGTTSSVVSATFFPFEAQNINIFNFPLPGTYALTSNQSAVVGSTANLTVGSLLMFNNTTALNEIFTVQSIADATHFTINPSWGINTTAPNATAETGLATAIASFSINLSEALPTNVQVISTVIGALNTAGNSNLVSATYYAEITSDIGSNQSIYSTAIPGITFTLSASASVTASSSSYPAGFGNGSSICFSTQPNTVYTALNVSGTTITLTIPYYGTASSTATAVFFNNSISDISTYNPAYNATTIGFGDPISLYITANNATATVPVAAFATNTQYLKIDGPSTAYTGTNGILRYNFLENIQMAITSLPGGTPSSLFISESPLVVKYRW